MNIENLRALVAVAETGSFQGAAERLFVTQSAVSMRMKALEESLAVSLFDRTSRPPVLTQTGRTAVERARTVLREVESLEALGQSTEGLVGTLRLGVIPSVTTRFLPDAMARLTTDHPKLQMRVEEGLSEPLLERVAIGDLDAAIITEPPAADPALMMLTVSKEALVLAMHKSLTTQAQRAHSDVALLRDRAFIHFNRQAGIGRIIDAALRDRNIRVRNAIELDSIEGILMMVSRGLGVALVPGDAIDPERWPDVVTQDFGDPPLSRKIALVVRRRMGGTPLVETVHRVLLVAARQ